MNKQYKYKGQEKKQKNKIFQDSNYVPLRYVRLKLVNNILFQAFTFNIFPTKPTQ